jgi:hypothetical protein
MGIALHRGSMPVMVAGCAMLVHVTVVRSRSVGRRTRAIARGLRSVAPTRRLHRCTQNRWQRRENQNRQDMFHLATPTMNLSGY